MRADRWFLLTIFALAWALPTAGQEKKEPPKRYSEEYFPIQVGYKWYYRLTDLKAPKSPDAATKKPSVVVIAADSEQIVTIKRKSKDMLLVDSENLVGFELQVMDPEKALQDKTYKGMQEQVVVASDGVYRVSGAGKQINPLLCILKKGVKAGDSWECDSQSENAQLKGKFTVSVEDVQVPAGAVKDALVVRSSGFQLSGQNLQLETWYMAKVGMVKQRTQIGNHEVILELEKVEFK
jgi:hypothetical protein